MIEMIYNFKKKNEWSIFNKLRLTIEGEENKKLETMIATASSKNKPIRISHDADEILMTIFFKSGSKVKIEEKRDCGIFSFDKKIDVRTIEQILNIKLSRK